MASIFRRSRTICQCQRSFSTSTPRAVSLQWEKNDPEALADVLPPYPYPTRWYKQSRLGLYGGQRIQFGNNVSEEFETKTRRSWHPNIFTRKLYSKALHRHVQVRVSSRVLRTIDKLGGLDEYLLGEKEARIKSLGESGWWLRWAIMQTQVVKNRFAEERRLLGLPEERDAIEAVTEAMAVPEEGEISEEVSETVPMDDAFQVEENAELPPIKFRVGRGQHVVLTANGWVRTRPSPEYTNNKIKAKLEQKYFPGYIEKRVEAYEAALDAQQTDEPLSQEDRELLVKHARRKFTKELKEELDTLFDTKTKVKEERRKRRRAEKLEAKKKAAEEDAQAVSA